MKLLAKLDTLVSGCSETRSPKTTAKLITCVAFFRTVSAGHTCPAFFGFTNVTEFMTGITILYRWRMCANKYNCLKGRGA